MSIYQKLANVQRVLVAPKGQRNDFGKYNYRSCEDILKAVKPLCDENGCMVFITNDMEQIGEFNYVKAIVTFVDLETGEQITSTAHAREEAVKKGMDGSQITGASSSYARKYALAGLFCIDNEKDSDATNKGEEISKEDAMEEMRLRAIVIKYINDCKMSAENVQKLCDHYKILTIKQMSAEMCKDYINKLKEKGVEINE